MQNLVSLLSARCLYSSGYDFYGKGSMETERLQAALELEFAALRGGGTLSSSVPDDVCRANEPPSAGR